jgi:hypothetical protein
VPEERVQSPDFVMTLINLSAAGNKSINREINVTATYFKVLYGIRIGRKRGHLPLNVMKG